MTTSPDATPATPVLACTVMDFARRLDISRRTALDLFGAAAAHLNVVVRAVDSGRLTVPPGDFERMVALVETLDSVGLTIRQLHRIQQSQDPALWALLQGPRAAPVARVDPRPETPAADGAVERIEAMLVDHLAQHRLMLDQHLSRPAPVHYIPAPVHYIPAPVPTPVRIRETQAEPLPVQQAEPLPVPVPVAAPALARPRQVDQLQVLDVHPDLPPPLPVPVPARAPSRGLTDWPEYGPMPALAPARAVPANHLKDRQED